MDDGLMVDPWVIVRELNRLRIGRSVQSPSTFNEDLIHVVVRLRSEVLAQSR